MSVHLIDDVDLEGAGAQGAGDTGGEGEARDPVPRDVGEFGDLYLAADTLEGDLVAGILVEHGIPAMIRRLRDTPFPVQTNIQDGVLIGVDVSRLEEAAEVLEQAQADGAIPDEGGLIRQ